MANKNLLGAGDIIVGAWENFKRHITLYASFVVWFVALAVVQWALLILTRQVVADLLMQRLVYSMASLPVSLGFALVAIGIVHLTAESLTTGRPNLKASFDVAIHQCIPFFWVAFLGGTLLMFGLMFFVLPAAYLLISLSFSAYYVILENVRGTSALAASRDLVDGRWWQVMWRVATPAVFYILVSQFCLSLIYLVIGSMLGDPGTFFGEAVSQQSLSNSHLLIATVVPNALFGLLLPLFVGSHLILWYDLRQRR